MAKVKVTLNQRGIAQLLNSGGVQAAVTDRGERVLAEARATAPVDQGEYRDNLHLEHVTNDEGVEGVQVTSGTDHDIYVEAEHGTLVRALDAAAGA